ncbi:MAG: hypothetical protein IJW91_04685 [Phascolarctobacterium sp.]|nr:hypothetical protein [Phascolarctobacterium sp.]MBQ7759768.1 hypothetical protein [Acidaminococcaceae bacterium]MBQ7883846.1 hypothetical protein [Phascolarctobacterium sp.]
MKKFLLGIKLSMLIIVVATIIAGIAAEFFLQNRWLGFFGVGVPLTILYWWQEYTKMAELNKKLSTKHKNKYR